MLHYLETSQLELGAVHKGRRKIFGLPSDILQHRNLRPPSPLKYSDVFYGWPCSFLQNFWYVELQYRLHTSVHIFFSNFANVLLILT